MLNNKNPAVLFDRLLLRSKRARAYNNFAQHDFIFKRATLNLIERLKDIIKSFPNTVVCGSRVDPEFFQELKNVTNTETLINIDLTNDFFGNIPTNSYVIADEETLPFGKNTIDLFLSILNLHSINDLPGALAQIHYSLKPDGLLLASLFGGETLYELRQAIMQAEMKLYNGVSPRVFPFTTKQQLGALLQRTHYALPVVDSDKITVTYPDLKTLLGDLKGMGESNIILERSKLPVSKKFFDLTEQIYFENFSDKDERLEATFEIIYITGWAPHKSQQKPLEPGSASLDLIDILEKSRSDLPH
jgi:SAM-dependent methyltransferase